MLKRKNIQIADQVIIDETAGEVVIGANTRICHGAVIQGPVVIGANCLIGNYAFSSSRHNNQQWCKNWFCHRN